MQDIKVLQEKIHKWTPILGIESYHRFLNQKGERVWIINCSENWLRKLGKCEAEALSLFYAELKENIGPLEDIRIVRASNAFSNVK